jgi:hypothetical protein
MYEDIMIDLETFSTRYDAAIASIGAIRFNRNGDDKDLFERIFTGGQSSLKTSDRFFEIPVVPDKGHIDPETVRWWLKQSKEAQESVANAIAGEAEALKNFANWLDSTRGYKIWAKSPSADCVWLDNAFQRNGMKIPWDFKSENDVRTAQTIARDVSGKSIKEWKLQGTHSVLIDCALQIYQVQESFRMMR